MDEQNEQTTPVVVDLTEKVPTLEPTTRSKIKKSLLAVTAVGAVILLGDDLVKRFRARKTYTLVVDDKPAESTTPPVSPHS